jgi:hypothetical protein
MPNSALHSVLPLQLCGTRKEGKRKTIFITYFELNPDFDPTELGDIAQKILSKGLYPPKGEKTIAMYLSTADLWGITIEDTENTEASVVGANMWRIAKPGIFKVMKTTPAMKLEELIPIVARLSKQLKGK